METRILKGRKVSKHIRENLKQYFIELSDKGIKPKIAVLYFGEDPSTLSYIKSKEKIFQKVGVGIEKFQFPETVNTESVVKQVRELNQENSVHGIIIEMPFPDNLDILAIYETIHPLKDIDCMNPINYGLLLIHRERTVPATAGAVIEILKAYDIELEGKDVTIIGRSNIVGKPLALLLLKEHATVTVCHTRTRDIEKKAAEADILVVSAGRPELINSNFVSSKSVVIDVGINFKNGKLCGDVYYDDVFGKVRAITPVPGGVGPVTTSYILKNLSVLMKDLSDE